MPSQIELLAALQIVDQSLREKRRAVEESEGRLAALDEALKRQTAAATEGRAQCEVLAARQRELEGKLGANEARVKDRRMRLNRVRNDKELQLLKREVEILREETGELETELVGVMEQSEAAQSRLKGIEEELASLNQALQTEAGELRERAALLQAEIDGEKGKRDALIGTVDEALRRRYEMIFQRRGGVAVVEMRGGVCQGCRMHVPPQLANIIQRNEQVNVCPNGQRILYYAAERTEQA